jgi:[ribosomal protein S18]-alanine N-acetyltransferase
VIRQTGQSARPNSFVDVWSFIRDIEPRGFLGAHIDGTLVGYAIFVPSLKRVQREAVRSGAVFRWAWAALRGGFGLRLSAIPRILANKMLFIGSAGRYRSRGDAQLLNIAVLPEQQGNGIATALVQHGLQVMRELGVLEVRLEVRPRNSAAVQLYRKTGWREAGRTRDIEGEWLVMVANP